MQHLSGKFLGLMSELRINVMLRHIGHLYLLRGIDFNCVILFLTIKLDGTLVNITGLLVDILILLSTSVLKKKNFSFVFYSLSKNG
jgi:hypothetical protein